MTDHFRLWQLADSAFPTGGFAHSSGLEAAWQQGAVRNRTELISFVKTNLTQAARAMMPFINEAYLTDAPIAELDAFCDVFLSNHVANRGSRAQGQALMIAAERSFSLAVIAALRAEVRGLPGHFAPCFGRLMRFLEISHECAVRLSVFLSLRSLLSSAVRLGIVGPMDAQSVQNGLREDLELIARRGAGMRLDAIAQTAPVLDILHGAQDRLYSRLFQT
jgi:urease accessory protein